MANLNSLFSFRNFYCSLLQKIIMSPTTICIKCLNSKTTDDLLRRLFSAYGTIEKINIFDTTAEITYASRDEALKAIENMNDKEILKSKVSVVLADQNQNTDQVSSFEFDKEAIGNIIYPLAKRKYATHASKLTGMICDAIFDLKNEPKMNSLIQSEKTLMELVEAAYKKLVLFNSEPIYK